MNLVRNDFVAELGMALEEPTNSGQVIVNLRAELGPDELATALREGLASTAADYATMKMTLDHLEHFSPGRPTPTPTHRDG